MEEKKKRLLELIELLNFPLPEDESRMHMDALSETQLDSLIETYENVWEYESAFREAVHEQNPEEYRKAKKKYNKEILDAEIEYADKLEEAQKKEEEKLDELEEKENKETDTVVADSKKKFEEVEAAAEDVALGFNEKPSTS